MFTFSELERVGSILINGRCQFAFSYHVPLRGEEAESAPSCGLFALEIFWNNIPWRMRSIRLRSAQRLPLPLPPLPLRDVIQCDVSDRIFCQKVA